MHLIPWVPTDKEQSTSFLKECTHLNNNPPDRRGKCHTITISLTQQAFTAKSKVMDRAMVLLTMAPQCAVDQLATDRHTTPQSR